jgi:hypothetical protein
MGKFLDDIKFERNNYDFFEELDVFGIKQIQMLTYSLVNFKVQDDFHKCGVLIDVLEEKVDEVAKCVHRLLYEIGDHMKEKRAIRVALQDKVIDTQNPS